MFERYENAKRKPASKFLRVTLAVSLAAHVVAGLVFLVFSIWKIEKIDPKAPIIYAEASMAPMPPPPPPPPPAKKSSVKKTEVVKPTKPQELVQPDKEVKPKAEEQHQEEDQGEDDGQEGGQAGGVPGGVAGGVVGGVVGSTGPPTPPPPPAATQNVGQSDLEALEKGGAQIPDPSATIIKMLDGQGLKKVKVKVKLCLTAAGGSPKLELVKPSGYSEVDEHVMSSMRKWQFRPFMVNGQGAPSCATWVIIFEW
jgi:protein TonB